MDDKFFKTMKPLQSRISNLCDIGVISVKPDYVQVNDNLFSEIIKGKDGLLVEFNKDYPELGAELEAQITINGVKYITVGTVQEFLDAGIPVLERE